MSALDSLDMLLVCKYLVGVEYLKGSMSNASDILQTT